MENVFWTNLVDLVPSQNGQTYVIDCYFRQTWTDHRLAYKANSILTGDVTTPDLYSNIHLEQVNQSDSNPNLPAEEPPIPVPPLPLPSPLPTSQKALALSIYMLDRIWKPPTYFHNSRQSHIHTITLPNKFVRIYSNGQVLYSSRYALNPCLWSNSSTHSKQNDYQCQLSYELGELSHGYSSK